MILQQIINKSNIPLKFQSELINKEYAAYLDKVEDALFNIEINEKKYKRHKKLLENELITTEEFELVKYANDVANTKYEQLVSSFQSNWQSRLKKYEQDY